MLTSSSTGTAAIPRFLRWSALLTQLPGATLPAALFFSVFVISDAEDSDHGQRPTCRSCQGRCASVRAQPFLYLSAAAKGCRSGEGPPARRSVQPPLLTSACHTHACLWLEWDWRWGSTLCIPVSSLPESTSDDPGRTLRTTDPSAPTRAIAKHLPLRCGLGDRFPVPICCSHTRPSSVDPGPDEGEASEALTASLKFVPQMPHWPYPSPSPELPQKYVFPCIIGAMQVTPLSSLRPTETLPPPQRASSDWWRLTAEKPRNAGSRVWRPPPCGHSCQLQSGLLGTRIIIRLPWWISR